MANKHASLDALFTDIADVIREKTGETGTIAAAQIPSVIRNNLQAAPIGFYVPILGWNTNVLIFNYYFDMNPGQTFNDFVNSDKNLGEFRINNNGFVTFLELFYFDISVDSPIPTGTLNCVRYLEYVGLGNPYMMDMNGNRLDHIIGSYIDIQSYFNKYGITDEEYINLGKAANKAVNSILRDKNIAYISDSEISDANELEALMGKSIDNMHVINTVPISLSDDINIHGLYDITLTIPLMETFEGAAFVLVTSLNDLSNPDSLTSALLFTNVNIDSIDPVYPDCSTVHIRGYDNYFSYMANTPCIISIIG